MSESLKLASPWISYVNGLTALLGQDPEIKISYSEGENEVRVYVDNITKAAALMELLPVVKRFGNVALMISVIPANEDSKADLFLKAFEGNPAFSYMKTVDGVFSNPISYLVFKNEVVQFYNDDLSDIHGNRSTLYQDLAEEIFENTHDGVSFCTDLPDRDFENDCDFEG